MTLFVETFLTESQTIFFYSELIALGMIKIYGLITKIIIIFSKV